MGNNLIHVRLEYEESKQAKRDILMTEVSLIKIAKAIQRYREFRIRELELKEELKERFEELRATMRAVKAYLPIPKIPHFLEEIEKKHEEKMQKIEKVAKPEKSKEKKLPVLMVRQEKQKEDPLEAQLKEIQEKLGQLE